MMFRVCLAIIFISIEQTDEQFASLAHTAKESRMDELEMRHTIKKIRDLLFLKRSLFTESLSALDPNHRGVISKESFMHGIRQMGVDVTDRQMSSLFSYFFGDELRLSFLLIFTVVTISWESSFL